MKVFWISTSLALSISSLVPDLAARTGQDNIHQRAGRTEIVRARQAMHNTPVAPLEPGKTESEVELPLFFGDESMRGEENVAGTDSERLERGGRAKGEIKPRKAQGENNQNASHQEDGVLVTARTRSSDCDSNMLVNEQISDSDYASRRRVSQKFDNLAAELAQKRQMLDRQIQSWYDERLQDQEIGTPHDGKRSWDRGDGSSKSRPGAIEARTHSHHPTESDIERNDGGKQSRPVHADDWRRETRNHGEESDRLDRLYGLQGKRSSTSALQLAQDTLQYCQALAGSKDDDSLLSTKSTATADSFGIGGGSESKEPNGSRRRVETACEEPAQTTPESFLNARPSSLRLLSSSTSLQTDALEEKDALKQQQHTQRDGFLDDERRIVSSASFAKVHRPDEDDDYEEAKTRNKDACIRSSQVLACEIKPRHKTNWRELDEDAALRKLNFSVLSPDGLGDLMLKPQPTTHPHLPRSSSPSSLLSMLPEVQESPTVKSLLAFGGVGWAPTSTPTRSPPAHSRPPLHWGTPSARRDRSRDVSAQSPSQSNSSNRRSFEIPIARIETPRRAYSSSPTHTRPYSLPAPSGKDAPLSSSRMLKSEWGFQTAVDFLKRETMGSRTVSDMETDNGEQPAEIGCIQDIGSTRDLPYMREWRTKKVPHVADPNHVKFTTARAKTSDSKVKDVDGVKVDEARLPDGWILKWSKTKDKYYFFDTISKNSTWQHPFSEQKSARKGQGRILLTSADTTVYDITMKEEEMGSATGEKSTLQVGKTANTRGTPQRGELELAIDLLRDRESCALALKTEEQPWNRRDENIEKDQDQKAGVMQEVRVSEEKLKEEKEPAGQETEEVQPWNRRDENLEKDQDQKGDEVQEVGVSPKKLKEDKEAAGQETEEACDGELASEEEEDLPQNFLGILYHKEIEEQRNYFRERFVLCNIELISFYSC